MIKINLAEMKQAGQQGNSRSSGGVQFPAFGGLDLSRFKDLPIRRIVLPLVVGLGASYMLEMYQEEELNKIQATVEKLAKDGKRFQADIDKFKVYESLKKTLDEDEAAIRTKLETIQKLVANRGDSVKLMNLLSYTIPAEVWLTELKVEKTDISIKGASLDLNQISDFMKNLKESSSVGDVELKNTESGKDNGSKSSQFELTAKLR